VVAQCREGFNFFFFDLIELVHSPDLNSGIIAAANQSISGLRHEYNFVDPVGMVVEVAYKFKLLRLVVDVPQFDKSVATRSK
jgi:hypothetical protein